MTDKKSINIKSETRKIFKHSVVYGMGNIFAKLIGFMLIPIYTKYLTPKEYGIIEILNLTTEFFGMILSFKISRAMYRFYFEYDTLEQKNAVVSTSFISFGVIGLFGILALFPFSTFFSTVFLGEKTLGNYFTVSFATLWFNSITLIGFYYLMIVQNSVMYVVASLIKLILNVIFNIYFIVFLELKAYGLLLGNLVSSILIFIIMMLPIIKKVGLKFSLKQFKDLTSYSLPMLPGALAEYAVLVSDRFLLRFLRNLADSGIYSLSYKFSVIPHYFITSSFFQIWSARRFELMKTDNGEVVMGRMITYFMILLTTVSLGICVLSKEVIIILADPKFYEAHKYIPVLTFSYIIFGLYDHFAVNIMIHKKTKYFTYVDTVNGVFFILLNLLLIPRFGTYGAAYATLVSYIFKIAGLYYFSARLGDVYFELFRFVKLLGCAFCLYILTTIISVDGLILSITFKTFIVMFFPVLLLIIGFFETNEISYIMTQYRSILNRNS
jgi:O-antigen/teichoic acid export membrane protein